MTTIIRKPITLSAGMYSAEWDVTRSAGTHLMQIVDRMEEERNLVLGGGKQNWASPDDLESYRFGGFIWEHAIAWHIVESELSHGGSLIRPGEMFWCAECDASLGLGDPKRDMCMRAGHKGIFATPDAIRTDTWRLEEWKFTWKSLKRAGADNDNPEHELFVAGTNRPEYEHIREGVWRWPIQAMAYCYLLDTLGADLKVFFVNGDYCDRVPKPMRYEMEFTPRDLKENWDGIVDMAKTEGMI